MGFPFYKQLNEMDCGPTCLRMIAKYYGKQYSVDTLRQMAGFSRSGVSLLGISETAEKLGFRTRGLKLPYEQLEEIMLPCILHWDQNHFVVLISNKGRKNKNKKIKIADPAKGIFTFSKPDFLKRWGSFEIDGQQKGVVLILEPTNKFHEQAGEKEQALKWRLVLQYVMHSRWFLIQVLIALLVSSLLQLILPFLAQSIVDVGITTQNLRYIAVVLIAQLTLVFSRTIVDFIRSRLLLRISNMLNLSILSDFWIKLTQLPLSYFDTRRVGDTWQRISDHRQIQNFLTGPALSTVFSLFNLVIFSIVLITYSVQLFLIFLGGNLLYFAWIQIFLRIRRKNNYETFYLSARENNATLQLIQGMQEIRLNNAEQLKRWQWEDIQSAIFKLNFRNLTYNQWQQAGALLINQSKDLTMSFIVAEGVIAGRLTLGAMIAVQYIIGQLSSPVEQFVGFMQSAQDAKISLERLNEIHTLKNEESADQSYVMHLQKDKSIHINHLTFTYPGTKVDPVLKNVTLQIPEGKITAIVGTSGSGKTTLLKLLLSFYEHYQGEINVGGCNFRNISPSFWRKQCGVVLQDGYIFNDTIAHNIAVGEETIDYEKLIRSCKIANIKSFIESLPKSFHTQLGADGIGISQGQKQRLLIARAIYKDPQYLFFDEATNALDAENEKTIVENLQHFFKGRTVIVVAHRLSTVKNADKVVVLHQGEIIEQGTHEYLSSIKGNYFRLVQNQLELGS